MWHVIDWHIFIFLRLRMSHDQGPKGQISNSVDRCESKHRRRLLRGGLNVRFWLYGEGRLQSFPLAAFQNPSPRSIWRPCGGIPTVYIVSQSGKPLSRSLPIVSPPALLVWPLKTARIRERQEKHASTMGTTASGATRWPVRLLRVPLQWHLPTHLRLVRTGFYELSDPTLHSV